MPAGLVAAASGALVARREHGERTTWLYLQRRPMATQLTQLAVGTYDVTDRGTVRGVPVRDLTAPTLTGLVRPLLAVELDQLD